MVHNELFEEAKLHFEANQYSDAEKYLNQLILKNSKHPHVFHMLGTILYDRGKFSKALRCFKRALELDPLFTDASIGLSILLNDLGRYEEGKKVFEEAQAHLSKKSSANHKTPTKEQIGLKLTELGEIFISCESYQDALWCYKKALSFSKKSIEISLKIVDCYLKSEDYSKAVLILKKILQEAPEAHEARIKLGKLYYDAQKIPEAINEWELVLKKDPKNSPCLNYIRLAQNIETIKLEDSPSGGRYVTTQR